MMYKLCIVIFSVIINKSLCEQPDYYWRDYNGEIPEDALEGGTDVKGNPTYIGQAFVLHHGILIAQIYPGQTTLITSKEQIHRTTVGNKILCTKHKSNFSWIRGTASKLHLTAMDQHLVAGGTEWGKILSIGRIKYEGQIKIGKVCSGSVGNAKLYFPYNDEEIEIDSYEILVYNETPSTPSALK